MRKKYLYICLAICLLVVTGCGTIPTLQNGEELVASIDGKEISVEDLYQELKRKQGTSVIVDMVDSFIADKEIPDSDELRQRAEGEVEMYRFNYESDGQNFEYVLLNSGFESVEDFTNYLVATYKKDEVLKNFIKSEFTDEDINKHYENEIFGEMTVRHILITPDSDNSNREEAEEEALNKARELITQIQNGENFEELAQKHSDDGGTKAEGGLFENFRKDNTDADFWQAAYELEVDEYTLEPVKSQFGYHIILKISSEDKPSLELVREEILDTLADERLYLEDNLPMIAWAKIRENYNFNIVDSDIDKIYNSTIDSVK